ncbi:Ribosomal-protein-alanine acetyltransferase [Halioglobus japonicus]|nr:Ribosomal-protein-alanine acetyltransferase [Halioglobus japonicus]
MTHTFRPAAAADAQTLAAIDASVNIHPWSEAQFAAACTASEGNLSWALVAEEKAVVVGFAVVSLVLDEATLLSIAVDPQRQRRGLGRALLLAALARAQSEGALRCLLEVRESNTAARVLYTASGFTLDGVRKNYYPCGDTREDALLMSKSLKGTANECA